MFPVALPPDDEIDYEDFEAGAGTRNPVAWSDSFKIVDSVGVT